MPVAVALIRGINVGGRNMLPMDTLRTLCQACGMHDPRTFIQSGNVVFRCEKSALAGAAAKLEAAIEKKRGFRPSVVVRSLADLRRVLDNCPFDDLESIDPARLLVMFLAGKPGAGASRSIAALKAEPQRIALAGREAYLYFPDGAGRAKTPMSAIEKAIGVPGTCRNWTTVRKLVEMGEAAGE